MGYVTGDAAPGDHFCGFEFLIVSDLHRERAKLASEGLQIKQRSRGPLKFFKRAAGGFHFASPD